MILIVQLSDLHFDEESSPLQWNTKIKKLKEAVGSKLSPDDELLFCICGDITDYGKAAGLENAHDFFLTLESTFSDHTTYFEYIPGNHDLIENSFIKFDEFIAKRLPIKPYSYNASSITEKKYKTFDLVLINTTFHHDYHYGHIDNVLLRSVLETCTNNIYIALHHTIVSCYNDDTSAIRNSYEFIKIISEYNVHALLHGHTHGYSDLTIGKQCKVIGVGPFLKHIPDINNQFNLIYTHSGKIINITSYNYMADHNNFIPITVYSRENNNHYAGSSLPHLYRQLVSDTKDFGPILNLSFKIETSFDEFKKSIEENFNVDIEAAELWSSKDVPDTLYYNHGTFIHKDDALKKVIESLSSKPTSNRALIPLINLDNVLHSGDHFLPSLDIIQFGFDSEQKDCLLITFYMRALEVNHFLKINISEAYLFAKIANSKYRSITKLKLAIFAFRAQYMERFGCFKRAKIDRLSEVKLYQIINSKNIEKLTELLTDKLNLSETVIFDNGISSLHSALTQVEDENIKSFYGNETIEILSKIKSIYLELKQLREITSNHSDVKMHEDELKDQITKLIETLQSLRG